MVVQIFLSPVSGQKRERLNDWPITVVIELVIENSSVDHYFSAMNSLTEHQFTSHDCSPDELIPELLLTHPACLLDHNAKT